jgi:hypothetical protein
MRRDTREMSRRGLIHSWIKGEMAAVSLL